MVSIFSKFFTILLAITILFSCSNIPTQDTGIGMTSETDTVSTPTSDASPYDPTVVNTQETPVPKVPAKYVRDKKTLDLLATHPGIETNNTDPSKVGWFVVFRDLPYPTIPVPTLFYELGLKLAEEFDSRAIDFRNGGLDGGLYGFCPKKEECINDEMYGVSFHRNHDVPFLPDNMSLAFIKTPGKPVISTIVVQTTGGRIIPIYGINDKTSDLPFAITYTLTTGVPYTFEIDGKEYTPTYSPYVLKNPKPTIGDIRSHLSIAPGLNNMWELFLVIKRYFDEVQDIPIPHPAITTMTDQNCGEQLPVDAIVSARFVQYAFAQATKLRPIDTTIDQTGTYVNYQVVKYDGVTEQKVPVSSHSIRRSCLVPGIFEYIGFDDLGRPSYNNLVVTPKDTGKSISLDIFIGSRKNPPDTPRPGTYGKEKVSNTVDEESQKLFTDMYQQNVPESYLYSYRKMVKKITTFAQL